MSAAKTIIVCADDFAQDQSISDAVLTLVDDARLSAVSCFTDSPLWPAAGAALAGCSERIYLGLHFNLTQSFDRRARPLGAWMARALLGAVDAKIVRSELERQVDRFVAVVGSLPDYIDGHHHVHAFPGVRDVVAQFAAAHAREGPIRIRRVADFFGPTDAALKRLVIRALARARGRAAGNEALYMNSGFSGDYSLGAADYAELCAQWIAEAPDRGLIMCHPGLASTVARAEYEFLRSPRYLELLAINNAVLARPTGGHRNPDPRPRPAPNQKNAAQL